MHVYREASLNIRHCNYTADRKSASCVLGKSGKAFSYVVYSCGFRDGGSLLSSVAFLDIDTSCKEPILQTVVTMALGRLCKNKTFNTHLCVQYAKASGTTSRPYSTMKMDQRMHALQQGVMTNASKMPVPWVPLTFKTTTERMMAARCYVRRLHGKRVFSVLVP
jgi:hypothetical protein